MVKRVLSSVLALAVVAAGSVLATAPAHAATFRTTATNLNIRSDAYLSASVIKVLAGPTSVEVDCQRSGDSVTVPGRAATTWWAHLPAHGGYATVGYLDTTATKLPGVPDCPPNPNPPADIKLADVQAMFGSRIANPSLVQTGLPSLNQAMRDANINTAYRKAAFLATLVHESRLEYNIREIGDTRLYGGRGYIQLTGDFNYGPAGRYFGIDRSAIRSWPALCSGARRSPAGTGRLPAASTPTRMRCTWAKSTPRSATPPAPRINAVATPSRMRSAT